jgi:hypothetical protein
MIRYDKEKIEQIKEYIAKNTDAETKQTATIPLRGRNVTLKVYRFPLSLLRYNKDNGRLVAQVEEWEKKNEKELDVTSPKGKEAVKKMLLELDPEKTKFLKDDIATYKQRDPGIIRADGVVINGNRRMAILSELFEKGKGEGFNYLNAAVLDDYLTDQDLFILEAKLQFATDLRSDYTPVNVLLTIERGLRFSTKETMANEILMLPRGIKELENDLEILEMMKLYLVRIGHPGEFWRLQKVYSHFNELTGIVKRLKKKKTPEEVEKYIEIGFKMIKCDVGHRELRPLNEIANSRTPTPQKDLFEALDQHIDLKRDDVTITERTKLLDAVELAEVNARNAKYNDQARVLLDRARDSINELWIGNCNIPAAKVIKELEQLRDLIGVKQIEFGRKKEEVVK